MARSDVSLLNFVVSDGRSLIATRYVSNADESPASLYYAEARGALPPGSGGQNNCGMPWPGGGGGSPRACALRFAAAKVLAAGAPGRAWRCAALRLSRTAVWTHPLPVAAGLSV